MLFSSILPGLNYSHPASADARQIGKALNVFSSAIGVPWPGVFYGTSPLSLKYKFNVTPAEALAQIETVVKYAKDKGLKLRFTAEDASRTDMDFLIRVALLVQKAGADRFSVADTVGVLTPQRMHALISGLKAEVEIPLHVHCHNDFGLATANALAALEAGARCADVTVNALGERCGLASLAEVSTALLNLYKVDRDFDLTLLPELTSRVEKAAGLTPGFNRPLVGEHAFTHKAGLHVRAVLKNPESYEAIKPDTVNRRRKLVLDKYTGKAAVRNRFFEMGLDLTENELETVLKKIKSRPEKVHWSGQDLRDIITRL